MDADTSDTSEPILSATPPSRAEVGAAGVSLALKAFALGASGSVAILGGLTETALVLLGVGGLHLARRAAGSGEGRARAQAVAALVQCGLTFGLSLVLGWLAVARMLDPRPIEAGLWALAAAIAALTLTVVMAWRRGERRQILGLAAVDVAVTIGVLSGGFLNAPGLDAAAGLLVAIWLFWGGLTTLREAAGRLLGGASSPSEPPAPPAPTAEPGPPTTPSAHSGPWSRLDQG